MLRGRITKVIAIFALPIVEKILNQLKIESSSKSSSTERSYYWSEVEGLPRLSVG